MKQFKNSLKTIFVMATIIVSSCGKDKTTTNTNSTNNNNTNPIATLGSVIHHGKTFPIKSVLSYGKNNEKTYNLTIDLSNADSNIIMQIATAEYLPKTADLPIANNIMPLANGKTSWIISYQQNVSPYTYYQESSSGAQAVNMNITNVNNEIQFVANNVQGLKMDATNGGLMSFNIKRMNPAIPSANATYLAPTGLDANNINIGSNSWNHANDRHQINYKTNGMCQVFVQNTTAPKQIEFIFKDGLPLSGTYDVVTSENAVTDGKVFIKFTSVTPLVQLSSSNTTQKLVVENINGEVKIYAKNIDLGTDVLNGLIIF